MTEVKAEPAFKRRRFVAGSLLLLFASCFAVDATGLAPGNLTPGLLSAIASLLTVCGIYWLVFWPGRAYQCPSCSMRLDRPTDEKSLTGDTINYYCPRCDVEWKSGMREQ